MDWDTALREPNGRVDPLGLYDLDRKVRPVGDAYRRLIAEWASILPTQSVVLALPIDPTPGAGARRDAAAATAHNMDMSVETPAVHNIVPPDRKTDANNPKPLNRPEPTR